MIIRPYIPADAPGVISLLHSNTPRYFAPEEEKHLLNYLANDSQHYFVIIINDMIVGSGGFNITADRNTGVLSWAIIHPDWQGKGIGSVLAKFRIEKMQQMGIPNIGVRTSQHVYKFYEKMGFALKEIEKDYWATGFDLYDMELDKPSRQ